MVMTQFFDNLIINQCFILILITCVVPQISLINVSPMVIKKNNNWPTLVLTIWWIWKQKFPCLQWVVCWVLCLCCYLKNEDQPFFLSRKMVSNFTFHQNYAMTKIGKLVGFSPNKAPTTKGRCCLHYHWSSILPYSPFVLQRLWSSSHWILCQTLIHFTYSNSHIKVCLPRRVMDFYDGSSHLHLEAHAYHQIMVWNHQISITF